MDSPSSDIDGDLPDVSSFSVEQVLALADTSLGRCMARIAQEMASGQDVVAAGFQSVIAPPGGGEPSAR